MKIYCKNCGQPLTLELQEATREALETEIIEEPDGSKTDGDLVRRGFWFDNDRVKKKKSGIYANTIGANLQDCTGLKTDDDPDHVGCCGLDGLNGLNKRCEKCGVLVGTGFSDCWTGRLMLFDKELINIENKKVATNADA